MKQILDYIIILFVLIVFLFPSKNLVTFINSRLCKIVMIVTIIVTYYQSKASGILLGTLLIYLMNIYYENYENIPGSVYDYDPNTFNHDCCPCGKDDENYEECVKTLDGPESDRHNPCTAGKPACRLILSEFDSTQHGLLASD